MNILLILGGALFLYALILKPEIVAILFFTITIADINFELGVLPMNIRAAIGLAGLQSSTGGGASRDDLP